MIKIDKIFLLIFVVFGITNLYSQDGWIIQNSGTTFPLNGICFTSADTGFIVGNYGTVLYTTNQGNNWISIDLQTTTTLKDIAFNNSQQGIIIGGYFGENPKIYTTSDGGKSWIFDSPVTWLYYSVDYTNNVITAVGYMGIIKRSYDNGLTWISKPTGIWPGPSQYSGVCFINSDTGYVVGGSGIIIYTENGGDVWTQQSSNTTTGFIGIDFISTNTGMVVGGNGTILKTTDAGNIWTQLVSGTEVCLYDVAMINQNKAIVIGAEGTILCTINGGETWIQQECPVTEDLFSIFAINDSTLFIVGDNGTILFTDDGGNISSPETPELIDPEDGSVNIQTNVTLIWRSSIHASSYEIQIAYSDDFSDIYLDTTVVCDTTLELYHLGAGTTYFWRVRAKNLSGNSDWANPPWHFTIIEDLTWYWEKLNFPDQDGIKQLIADSSGGLIAVVNGKYYWSSKFYHSTDKGNTWEFTGEHDIFHCSVINKKNQLFGCGPQESSWYGEPIFRSDDFGNTWNKIRGGMKTSDPIEFRINKKGFLYIRYLNSPEDSYYIDYTQDDGETWNSSFVTWVDEWGQNYYSYRFFVNDSSYIYLCKSNYLLVSKNYGLNYDTLLVINENDYFTCNADLYSNLFLGCDSSGMFRSVDEGKNWTNIGLSGNKITSINYIDCDTLIVTVEEQGIFSSFDNGDTWVIRNSGISDLNISSVVIDKSNNIYLANADGLYRNSALWVNPVEEDLQIPDKFILKQNYPNPFNSSTTIRFTLPNEDKVTVSVFDIRGQFISNLYNGRLNKGSHKFFWNASYLSSGIYFCCVQIGNRIYSQKMLLIK